MNRLITYGLPGYEAQTVVAPAEISSQNIYKTIEWFAQLYPANLPDPNPAQTIDLELVDILNLHNIEGVSNVQTIRELITKIRHGQDIFNLENGSPNVHLANVDNVWVAINGHHTIMAYIICGKTKLSQLPYLTIGNEQTGKVPVEEIISVFNEHRSRVSPTDWQAVALDWSAPPEQQLVSRIQKNMGELTDAFVNRYRSELSL